MSAVATPAASDHHQNPDRGTRRTAAQKTDQVCPVCNMGLLLRKGANGPFLACSGYPDCRFTANPGDSVEPAPEVSCPDCGSPMRLRTSRSGRQFFSCICYPDCNGIRTAIKDGDSVRPARAPRLADMPCPLCGEKMLEYDGRTGAYLRCTIEACGKTVDIESLRAADGKKCPSCEKPMVRRKGGRNGHFLSCTCYPECTATREIDEPKTQEEDADDHADA